MYTLIYKHPNKIDDIKRRCLKMFSASVHDTTQNRVSQLLIRYKNDRFLYDANKFKKKLLPTRNRH